jgi:hypothetical protein
LVGGTYVAYIVDSYATGQITVTGSGEYVGGFSGRAWGDAYDCFWDTETSQISTSGFGTGLTTIEMQDPNTFISAGWDLAGESDNGPSDIWVMPDSGGYPLLWWQVSPLPALPSFSGGLGEPNDPFIISTPEELSSIGHNPRLMSAHLKLANDIDLGGISFFLMGSEGYPFRGVFDGNGHTIHNFSHEAFDKHREYIGLFRYVRDLKAEIRDVVLTRSTIVNDIRENHYVGSLIGMLYDGIVANCRAEDSSVSVSGTFTGNSGGLIGSNSYGIIDGCSSAVAVRGEDNLGGLLGTNLAGLVFNCHSTGDVSMNLYSGARYVGGLVGWNWAIILGCSASGSVVGDEFVGGLVGDNIYIISESCSYGNVEGDGGYGGVGGLVGRNLGYISNSYARGGVRGAEKIGGLVGYNTYVPLIAGSIETSYSTGSVSGVKDVGGLVHTGSDRATTSDDCFWDIETSGQTTSDGGIGKTTAEMQAASTFLDAGWDFVDETANGTDDIWWILEGQDYPRLWWELNAEN